MMQQWVDFFKFGKELQRAYFIAAFCISCLLLIIFTTVIYKQSRNVEESNAHVTHSYEVLRQSRRIMVSALNLETGQRGYLLTGSKFFLEPYNQSVKALEGELNALSDEVRNDPEQVEFVNNLELKLNAQKLLLQEQVEVFRKRGAWALNVETLKQSKMGMDEVRDDIDVFAQKEMRNLKEWRTQAKEQIDGYFLTLFIGAALSIGALVLANLIILRLLARNRNTEEERRHFEESYQLLLTGVRDGIFDLYPELGVTQFSPGYKALLGYSSSELQQMAEPFRILIHPDDYPFFEDELQRFIRREISDFNITHRLKHKDGRWVWMLARAIAISSNNAVKRIIGVHTDISAQKAYEDQLKQMNVELEGFTYIASHDLRAPLVNLKGFSTEMQQAINDAAPSLEKARDAVEAKDREIIKQTFEKDIPEALGFIQASVEKMDKLTTAILDLSRIGRRQYRSERVDANAIVKRCLDAMAYEISERGVTVEVDHLPRVTTDALAFEQIMSNLLDNAIKYLLPDRPGRIAVKAKQGSGEILFIVSDNGRGIADSDRTRVFDIFRRASNSGDVRGIGMGMAYVQATVRKLGGRIWFESTLNEGSTFYFTLPGLPGDNV